MNIAARERDCNIQPIGALENRREGCSFLQSFLAGKRPIGCGSPERRPTHSDMAICLGLATANAIGAASGTGQEVFNALDSNISPEHVLENGLF